MKAVNILVVIACTALLATMSIDALADRDHDGNKYGDLISVDSFDDCLPPPPPPVFISYCAAGVVISAEFGPFKVDVLNDTELNAIQTESTGFQIMGWSIHST